MKIVYISNLYFPEEIGGAEMYVRRIAEAMATSNEVSVITTTKFSWSRIWKPSVERVNGVTIYRFYPLNICSTYSLRGLHPLLKPIWHVVDLYNLQARWMVRTILRLVQPDVVHSHNVSGLSPSVFSAIRREGRKILHTLHDYHFLSPWSILFRRQAIIERFNVFDRWYMSWYRTATRCIDVVTAPSQFVLNIHRQHGFFADSQAIKIPLGIDSTAQREVDPTPNIPRKTFLYLGQVTKYKGVHVLLQALAHIPNLDLEVVIAGIGPDIDELQKSTNDPRVQWAGFIRGQKKEELIRRALAVVVPSIWYDNSPVTIYESLAMGVPVIASKIGGIPELVQPQWNGLLFPPGDARALAGCLQRVLKEVGLVNTLRSGAEQSCRAYSIAKHLDTLNQLYRQQAGTALIP